MTDTDTGLFELVDVAAPPPIDVELTAGELALCEQLLTLRSTCNAMPGHDWQSSTYGAVSTALIAAIAQAVRNAQAPGQLLPAKRIAEAVADSAIDNGENIAYQFELMRAGKLVPWGI